MFNSPMVTGSGMAQAQVQPNTAYQNQPKELGLIQRVEGLRSGLDEIHSRLKGLGDRLSGMGGNANTSDPTPCGLPGNLSCAETRIREILTLIDMFDRSF